MNRRALVATIAGVALLAACATTDIAVEPVWGKQPCAHCAMVLSDERFGAQLVTDAGERSYFDDVGCMVVFVEERGTHAKRSWVRDAQTARWVVASSARYVGGVASPMDFGFEARAEGGVGWDEMRVAVLAKKRGMP